MLRYLGSLYFVVALVSWAQLCRAQDKPRLFALSGNVKAFETCQTYPKSLETFVQVDLHFKNVTDEPVILSRRVEWGDDALATTREQAEAHSFVAYSELHDAIMGEPPLDTFGSKPDKKRFVILNPGDEFSTPVWMSISIGTDDSTNVHVNGHYLMQLGIKFWPYWDTRPSVVQLEKKWSKFGRLAAGYQKTDFFDVTFPGSITAKSCDKVKVPLAKAVPPAPPLRIPLPASPAPRLPVQP